MQYQVGGSLTTDAPSYIRRRADDDFAQALQQGEFCYVLNSRQVGKSSLMVRSHQKFTRLGYRCAVLDMTNIGSENITPLQWYKGIVKDLWRSFKLTRQADFTFKAWWKDEEDISLLQRLSQFIKDVLLAQFPDDEIIIFIDEIDSILSLPFSVDDFFALVRFCYNQRAIDPEYKRIHFAIFGVAAPADLIRDRTRTPFNIGTPIYLNGFTQSEAQPLANGLTVQKGEARDVLKAILAWTEGQPFLTQKLCQLAISSSQDAANQPLTIPPGNEAYWVENLVQKKIIDRWESQDEPEHLRTIRNRILNNADTAGRLLALYQQVLEGEVTADDSRDQIELVLSGLVRRSEGLLQVKNRIYGEIFNQGWIKHQLSQLRPYAQQLEAWVASKKTDESRLLRGQALKDAQLWSQGKRLSDLDYQYLAASVESDRQAVHQAMAAERQAAENERVQLQLEKEQEASKLQRRFLGAVSAAFLAAVGFGGVTFWQYRQSRIGEIEAIATAAEGRFESHHQLEAFEQIITAATKLEDLVRPPAQLTTRVQQVLQRTLDGANAINQLNFDTEVASLAVHPDGDVMAVVTAEGELSFWHPNGKRAADEIQQAIQPNRASTQPAQTRFSQVLFSPNGQQIAIALQDNRIQLWDFQRGTLIKTFQLPQPASDLLGFSPDHKQLLIKSSRVLSFLNLDSGDLTSLAAEYPIGASVLSPDGQLIAGNYKLPPPGPDRPGRNSPGFSRNIPSPGQGRFAGPPTDRVVLQDPAKDNPNLRVWDAAGDRALTLKTVGGPIFALAISPTRDLIASAHVDGEIRLTRPDGELEQVLFGLRSPVKSLAFSPDGALLASGDTDGGIHLWTVGGSRVKSILGHKGKLTALRFSPDGSWLVSASQDSTVRLWKVGHPLHTILAAHTDAVTGVFYSPDGQRLHSHSVDQSMNIWQRNPQGTFERAPAKTFSFISGSNGFSVSDDRQLMARMQREAGAVVTDNPEGSRRLQLDGLDEASAVSVAPSGNRLAIATRSGQIQTWEKTASQPFPAQPQQTWRVPEGLISVLVWGANENLLVSGTRSGTVTLWENGVASASVEAHRAQVNTLAVSPDGRWIALASKDKTIKIWRPDGTLVQTLLGHEAGIDKIVFSPDSTRLASVSVDSNLKLWHIGELSPGQDPLLRSISGHVGEVNDVAFSPDGTEVATVGRDRKAIVWKIDEILQLDELDYACNQVRDYLRSALVVDDEVRSLCD